MNMDELMNDEFKMLLAGDYDGLSDLETVDFDVCPE